MAGRRRGALCQLVTGKTWNAAMLVLLYGAVVDLIVARLRNRKETNFGRRERFGNGHTEARNKRFTVRAQSGGAESMVMVHLCCDLATLEVAAFVGRDAYVTSRYSADEHPVGVHCCRIYLLTMVHLGTDSYGRWGHLALVDTARNRTDDLRA